MCVRVRVRARFRVFCGSKRAENAAASAPFATVCSTLDKQSQPQWSKAVSFQTHSALFNWFPLATLTFPNKFDINAIRTSRHFKFRVTFDLPSKTTGEVAVLFPFSKSLVRVQQSFARTNQPTNFYCIEQYCSKQRFWFLSSSGGGTVVMKRPQESSIDSSPRRAGPKHD